MAVLVIVVLVAVQLAGSFSKGQIVFLQEPKNVTVAERTDAFFACSYRGTSGVPSWRINNTVFVISALPPKHSYNGSGLVVSSVDLSLNMTSYTCFFSVYIGRGEFEDIQSNTGFVIIAENESSIYIHLKPSSSTAYLGATIYDPTASAANTEPTITVSMVEQLFIASEQTPAGAQPIATETAAPLTLKPLRLPLVIAGVATGIGISLVVIIVFTVVVCVITQRSRALKTKGSNEDTKEGEMDINVKENAAYEVPPSRIKMTENEAYAIFQSRS